MSSPPILDIRSLSLEFPTYRGAVQALDGVSLQVAPGEIVALVGESGSGKSVAAMSAIRLMPPQSCRITGGSIAVVGRDVLALGPKALAEIRGKQVSMVFQEPMSALNPSLRIGRQITEVLRRHEAMDAAAAGERAVKLLAEMQVADPARIMRSYPFELSGGMRQRVLIAMAFACNPQLLIADEPTTALDVTVQAQVLALISERARARRTAVLFITHDLAVVSQLCSRIYVMYAGQIVESGTSEMVLGAPRHPYTRALLRSLPDAAAPGAPLHAISGTVPSLLAPPAGCRFRSRCERSQERCKEQPPFDFRALDDRHGAACWYPESGPIAAGEAGTADARTAAAAAPPILVDIEGIEVHFPVGTNWRGKALHRAHALNGVDLQIRRGETLAIVGESGCGKSTLAQVVLSLLRPSAGRLRFDGVDVTGLAPGELRRLRRRFQIVFQDPQASLDPRMSACDLIGEPLQVAGRGSAAERRREAERLAALVGIRAEQLDRYAHEFSGGQRQRLAIARALALEPELLVLDEPTSALDVSIQAQILNLLMELQARLGLTYLFISHNVSVVQHIADRVAVMYLGEIVELGRTAAVLEHPAHPYTRQLIAAVPRLHRRLAIPELPAGEPAGNLELPGGCFFRARCAVAGDGCDARQNLRTLADGRQARCHRAAS